MVIYSYFQVAEFGDIGTLFFAIISFKFVLKILALARICQEEDL